MEQPEKIYATLNEIREKLGVTKFKGKPRSFILSKDLTGKVAAYQMMNSVYLVNIELHKNSQNFSSAWYLTYAEYLLTDIDLNIYTISSYLAWVERGMGALYTWSIGNCATWCNIPASLSCHLLVAFTPLNIVLYMPVISLFNFFIY